MNDQTSSIMSSSVYNELRLSGNFCDAVIKVQGVEFKVHKVILCKCSPYFRALFSRWAFPGKTDFEIPGLSSDMMRLIIEFAYTDSVSITEDNVQELLLSADQFNVMDIVKACWDFIGNHLSPENCIGIWHFTDTCFCVKMRHKSFHYIIDNFEEVVSCDEFQSLSVEELAEFIERDDLNVKKESTVFEAVHSWITFAPEERKQYVGALMSKVRLAMVGGNYIRRVVMFSELMKQSPECLHMALEASQIIEQNITNRPFGSCSIIARPRLPREILLAIGGWSGGDPTNGIEAYDIRANCWTNLTNPDERPRAYHGSVFLNGFVYCIGGFDRLEYFNSVRRFDLSNQTWHEAAPMYCRRCYVSVTVLNGCIYAMGGYDGNIRLNTAERYTPKTNQWSFIASMHESRSDASCTTLNNRVYICGGFNGNECLETCEFYSPETNQWTRISSMNSRRSGIGVIAYSGHVFAVGGFDGSNRLCSAEAYNPRTNTWHIVSSMMTTRSNFGIEVIDDLLFVAGGFNGFTTSYCVEYYNITTNEWSEACDMDIFRSALSCCVVSGLTNMADFVIPRDSMLRLYFEDDLSVVDSEDTNSDSLNAPDEY